MTYVLKEKITIAGSIFYAGEECEHGVRRQGPWGPWGPTDVEGNRQRQQQHSVRHHSVGYTVALR